MKPLTLFGMVSKTKIELIDSETPSSSEANHGNKFTNPKAYNGESRNTDTTTGNRTRKSISKDIIKIERRNRVYAIYAALP